MSSSDFLFSFGQRGLVKSPRLQRWLPLYAFSLVSHLASPVVCRFSMLDSQSTPCTACVRHGRIRVRLAPKQSTTDSSLIQAKSWIRSARAHRNKPQNASTQLTNPCSMLPRFLASSLPRFRILLRLRLRPTHRTKIVVLRSSDLRRASYLLFGGCSTSIPARARRQPRPHIAYHSCQQAKRSTQPSTD